MRPKWSCWCSVRFYFNESNYVEAGQLPGNEAACVFGTVTAHSIW